MGTGSTGVVIGGMSMGMSADELQHLFHRYQDEHGGVPETPYKVIEWAISQRLVRPPEIDPVAILADNMARALREEYATDVSGRRYRRNHAVRVTRNSVQFSLWAEIENAPHDHMTKAFSQRRRQIIGDCLQLKTDVDVYNGRHAEMEQIPLVLDFTDDVADLQAIEGRPS